MDLKPFGYNRIRLMIPQEWELARAVGNSRRGELVFDDGEEPRLSVQWTPCDPAATLDAIRAKTVDADRNLTVLRQDTFGAEHAFTLARTDLGKVGISVVLDRHGGRAICVRQFRPKGNPGAMAQAMTRPLLDVPRDGLFRWTFFATDFLLGGEFELTDAKMQAGVNRLDFRGRGRELTVWDFSLLNQIEKTMPAQDFAERLVAREFPRRYVFDGGTARAFRDGADFCHDGRLRLRWLVHPLHLLIGNRHAVLEGCANRAANRLGVVFWRFRSQAERDWAAPLAASLRGAPEQRMSA